MMMNQRLQIEDRVYYTNKKHHNKRKFQLLAFNLLMVIFVALALMQMFELHCLLSETKAVNSGAYPASVMRSIPAIQNVSNMDENYNHYD